MCFKSQRYHCCYCFTYQNLLRFTYIFITFCCLYYFHLQIFSSVWRILFSILFKSAGDKFSLCLSKTYFTFLLNRCFIGIGFCNDHICISFWHMSGFLNLRLILSVLENSYLSFFSNVLLFNFLSSCNAPVSHILDLLRTIFCVSPSFPYFFLFVIHFGIHSWSIFQFNNSLYLAWF
jgi:hypothetical protein